MERYMSCLASKLLFKLLLPQIAVARQILQLLADTPHSRNIIAGKKLQDLQLKFRREAHETWRRGQSRLSAKINQERQSKPVFNSFPEFVNFSFGITIRRH
ncbi:LOW QUALITY PROTEIN: hypothetical protein TorRG33x02_173630 [Trema orientale]|uniref:Uncharacterized protein n=1 Tax=Trema orientale TaxID=63057 RepID=A0A2P5EMP1_TREOI|nr:LOW QUALITY PROTEIN: hypothetical protein TorRG33x02_173630 [Trema orientale]